MSDKNIIIESISNHNNSLPPLENKKNNKPSLIEKFYWIKPTSFDKVKPFNFKQAPWIITVIFLFSVVIIPTILSLTGTYVLSRNDTKTYFKLIESQPFIVFLMILVPLMGFFASMIIDKNFMVRSGAWIAYSMFFIEIITMIISFFFVKIHNIVVLLSATFFLIFTNKEVQKRIIYTFKEKKLTIVTVTILYCIASIAIIFLQNIILSYFITRNPTSKNQEELDKLKGTPWGVFQLFFFTCFAAPISEEFNCRFGIFTICRTPWLGFIVSTFYFAAMHVMYHGDWKSIIFYLPLAFILSLLYINTRGNIVYPIFLHLLFNFLTFII